MSIGFVNALFAFKVMLWDARRKGKPSPDKSPRAHGVSAKADVPSSLAGGAKRPLGNRGGQLGRHGGLLQPFCFGLSANPALRCEIRGV